MRIIKYRIAVNAFVKQRHPDSRSMFAGGIVGILATFGTWLGLGKAHDMRVQKAWRQVTAAREASLGFLKAQSELQRLRIAGRGESKEAKRLGSELGRISNLGIAGAAQRRFKTAAEQRSYYHERVPRNLWRSIPFGAALGGAAGAGIRRAVAVGLRRRRKR